MQNPTPDFLTPHEADEMRSWDQDLMGDEQAGVDITYEAMTDEGSYDPDTGQQTPQTSSASFSAPRSVVDAAEEARTDGQLEVGDRRYLIDATKLPRTPPSVEDRIKEGGTWRTVIAWQEDETGDAYVVEAREV